jgi:pilus assembly protein CpaB
VVVAVPEKLLSRLMLASQAGPLRLAVRSAEEKNLERYWAGDSDIALQQDTPSRNITHFNQLSMGAARSVQVGSGEPRKPRSIEIIRGIQTAQQTP